MEAALTAWSLLKQHRNVEASHSQLLRALTSPNWAPMADGDVVVAWIDEWRARTMLVRCY